LRFFYRLAIDAIVCPFVSIGPTVQSDESQSVSSWCNWP